MSTELLVALRQGRGVRVKEFAREAKTHPVTVYRAIGRGEIPVERIGRIIIIPAVVARRLLGMDPVS